MKSCMLKRVQTAKIIKFAIIQKTYKERFKR
jgi:hypothetical protein